MKKVMILATAAMLALASTTHGNPANSPSYACSAKGGLKSGKCGLHMGCIVSEAVGGFDCYQELPTEIPPYWPDDNGFSNPFVPDVFGGGELYPPENDDSVKGLIDPELLEKIR